MTINSQSIHVCLRMARTAAPTVSHRVAGTQTEIVRPPVFSGTELAIYIHEPARHSINGEIGGSPSRRTAQSLQLCGLSEQPDHGYGEGTGIAGRYQHAIHAVRKHLVEPRAARGDDRATQHHRLEAGIGQI